MPKRINKKSVTGLFCSPVILRTGHLIEASKMCCSIPKTLSEHVRLFTEQMQHINNKFFIPFTENPLNIELNKTYCDIVSFFNDQRLIYANNDAVLVQIDFISEAMKIIRTDATQYYLRTLQNEALARELEGSIEGLLLHIYLLNSRVAILSSYSGDNSIKGSTGIKITTIEDTRHIMARTQPELSMINFLFPDEPTFKYYSKIKHILEQSGLYPDRQAVIDDLKQFLDRFIIQYDLGKTIEEYMEENNANNDNNEIINDDVLKIDERNKKIFDQWREQHGDTILDGSFAIELTNIDKNLEYSYYKSEKELNKYFNFSNKDNSDNCGCPTNNSVIVPYMFEGIGRMMQLEGCLSINSLPSINLDMTVIESALKNQNAWARTRDSLFVNNISEKDQDNNNCVQVIKKNNCGVSESEKSEDKNEYKQCNVSTSEDEPLKTCKK